MHGARIPAERQRASPPRRPRLHTVLARSRCSRSAIAAALRCHAPLGCDAAHSCIPIGSAAASDRRDCRTLTCRQTPALAPADPAEIGMRVCNARATVCADSLAPSPRKERGEGADRVCAPLITPSGKRPPCDRAISDYPHPTAQRGAYLFACFLGNRSVFVQAAEIEEIPKGMTTIIYSLSCRT